MINMKDENNVITLQLYILVISLVTTIVSMFLTYNQKLEIQNKKTLFTPKKTLKITKTNRIVILITSIAFLYINYSLYKISKENGEKLKPYKLQILASILTVISTLIVLYVVLQSTKETVADVENPLI